MEVGCIGVISTESSVQDQLTMRRTLLVGSSETLHHRRPNHHTHDLEILLLKRPDTGRLRGLFIRFCVCQI